MANLVKFRVDGKILDLFLHLILGTVYKMTRPADLTSSNNKNGDSDIICTNKVYPQLKMPIVLWGLMGAGKTKTGAYIAQRLNVPFYDADIEIEQSAGMTISDIFQKFGETYFRQGERKVIRRLLDEDKCVIALGGGAVVDDGTRDLLKMRALNIWLQADVDLLVKRTESASHRPLLNTGNPAEILSSLLEKREKYYREADIIVKVEDKPAQEIGEKIMNAVVLHMKGNA